MGCWFLFLSWLVQTVVIVTLCKTWLLMTIRFPNSVPFPGRGSTLHPQMIYCCFLVLSFCCLHCYNELTSPPQVVYVLGVLATGFCNGTIHHRRKLESLGNCPYPVGYCYSSHHKSLSIVQNWLTWVVIPPEISWCRCQNRTPLRSC